MTLRKPALGTVLGATALAVALVGSGGVAEAAKLINGKLIKPNTVTTKQIKDGTIAPADLSAAAKVAGPKGARGSAVASGHVANSGGTTTVTLASGVSGTTANHPGAGKFCVTVPGYPSTTHVIVVALDYSDASTTISDRVMVWSKPEASCAAGSFLVLTTDSGGTFADAGFTFVVN